MHALRHVHRLVVAGGTLLDLHPVTEQHVYASDGAVGAVTEPDFDAVLANVEASVGIVIADGLYELDAETSLDVLQHFDTAEDLLEHKTEELRGEQALVERILAAPPPFVVSEHAVLRRFRVC